MWNGSGIKRSRFWLEVVIGAATPFVIVRFENARAKQRINELRRLDFEISQVRGRKARRIGTRGQEITGRDKTGTRDGAGR